MTKLLLITRNAWSNEISTGNTMSNYFADFTGEIANLYCRDEKMHNDICKEYYQITEGQLLGNILHKTPVGKRISLAEVPSLAAEETAETRQEAKKYSFFRAHRLQIFLWAREIIWKLGKWENAQLDRFLEDIRPDVLVVPLYDCFYMYDILFYVQKKTGARVALYTGDDIYTLKQWSLSPLYWIDRFIRRAKIRKAVKLSFFRFCLTEKQAREYTEIFGVPFQTGMKSTTLSEKPEGKTISQPLQIVYTGNLNPGRYKTLDLLGRALDAVNGERMQAEVHIYSGDVLSDKMRACLAHKGMVFHGSISGREVAQVQKAADIVLHAEDFALKSKLQTRLSLSTKIVDYLSKGKCILAIGPGDIASMEYLLQNDAAVCVTDKTDILPCVQRLCARAEVQIPQMGEKALLCAQRNHNARINRQKLYEELEKQ